MARELERLRLAAAITFIGETLQRYTLLLTARSLISVTPTIQVP